MSTPTIERLRYVVGLDVGTYSLGVAAVEVEGTDQMPVRILHALSTILDAGVDPTGYTSRESRRAVSGSARRLRRLYRQRRKVYRAVDEYLSEHGYPLTPYEPGTDTDPWLARTTLVEHQFTDEDTLRVAVSIAARHMVRHRGWRNPWQTTDRLHRPEESSADMIRAAEHVSESTGRSFTENVTFPQLVSALRAHDRGARIRGEYTDTDGTPKLGLLSRFRPRQSDHARELRHIERVQGLDPEFITGLIDVVFAQKHPGRSGAERVGADPLFALSPDPEVSGSSSVHVTRRGLRMLPAFQQYRIAAQLTNARLVSGDGQYAGRLGADQVRRAFDLLCSWSSEKKPSWLDVAEHLDMEPGRLRAPAQKLDDGENTSGDPLIDTTHSRVMRSKNRALARWWEEADPETRRATVLELLSGTTSYDPETNPEDSEIAQDAACDFHSGLDDSEADALDTVRESLESGRAAYSEYTLRVLTEHMLATGDDLHDARRAVFGVPADWTPPASPLSETTGNPVVDRNLSAARRALDELERRYGPPERVTIEHAREGAMTAKRAKEVTARNTRKSKALDAFVAAQSTESDGSADRNVRRKIIMVARQNSQCLYCGTTIDVGSCHIDHIVPRAGGGAKGSQSNLAACCAACNSSKGARSFRAWAVSAGVDRAAVKERVKNWTPILGGAYPGERAELRGLTTQVTRRINQKVKDEAVDERATESFAWAATELARRLTHRYNARGQTTKVAVFNGRITALARSTWLSGDSQDNAVTVQNTVDLYGSVDHNGERRRGKNRLDRRHHAVDAVVISMMRQFPATVLAQRAAFRDDPHRGVSGESIPWQEFEGASPAQVAGFRTWQKRTLALVGLLADAVTSDQVPVARPQRTRLGSGPLHSETTLSFDQTAPGRTGERRRVGDAWTPAQVSKIADHRAWVALTRVGGHDWRKGLAADPARCIRVGNKVLGPDDLVNVFGGDNTGGCISVNDGWCELGDSWHHMRLYQYTSKGGKTTTVRERAYTTDLSRQLAFTPGQSTPRDLTKVDLPRHSVSRRMGIGPSPGSLTYAAHMQGQTTYIGSLFRDDEIIIPSEIMGDRTQSIPGHIQTLQEVLNEPVTRWKVAGTQAGQLLLRPAWLSDEGAKWLAEGSGTEYEALHKALGTSWNVVLSTVFSWPGVRVVRRTVLGEERSSARAGVPVCWHPPYPSEDRDR